MSGVWVYECIYTSMAGRFTHSFGSHFTITNTFGGQYFLYFNIIILHHYDINWGVRTFVKFELKNSFTFYFWFRSAIWCKEQPYGLSNSLAPGQQVYKKHEGKSQIYTLKITLNYNHTYLMKPNIHTTHEYMHIYYYSIMSCTYYQMSVISQNGGLI